MGEMTSKLKFRTAPALTSAEFRTGSTAYEAEAEGVKYRVVGIPKILGAPGSGRTFGAYRVVEGGKLHPAAGGGVHRTRAAAYEQAERDLANVLRDRQAQDVAARTAARVDAEVPALDSDHPVARAVRVWRGRAPALAADDAPAADPALDDNVPELVDRIVRRSQYTALKSVLAQLDGWIERAEKTCRAEDHGDGSSHDDGRPCGRDFDVADFRTMVNGAANQLGVPRPYRPAVDDA